MRILYTIMAYGPQIIASEVHSELGREFQAKNHTFSVLSLEANSFPDEDVKLYTINFKNSFWHRLIRKVSQPFFQYAFFIELILGLARFLRQNKNSFDIVHVEAAYPLGAAWTLASWLSGASLPFVINLQGADVMNLPAYDYGYGRYWLPRQLIRLAFKRCSRIRANSEQTAELAVRLGAKPKQIQTIYRNISDQIFPDPNLNLLAYKQDCQQKLRTRYNLSNAPILIAYSRLHPFKGLNFLIEALPILTLAWPNLNVLICGPSRTTPQFGDYQAYLERLAQQHNVTKNVIFTGKINFADSAEYLAGADLLIIPSVVEALNKVAIEAAAVGTPSIITDTTGIARAAVAGKVAKSIRASNAKILAHSIRALLINKTEWQTLSAHGPIWAKSFNSENIALKLLDLYKAALGNLCYVAYPSSLILKSANAIQTFSTCQELKKLAPDTLILLPRLPGRSSHFTQIGAVHLLRWPFNFFNNFQLLKTIPWSYVERTVFAFEAGLYLWLKGQPIKAIYVRDVICAYWLIKFWQPLLHTKIIYEAHDLEARNPSRAKALRRWLEKVDRIVNGQSAILVSLTATFGDYLIEQNLRAANQPMAIIPDAYDDQTYYPLSNEERLKARQALGFEADEFIIVYSGLTFAYRSLDKLVIAFGKFRANHLDVKARLIFVGGRDFEQTEILKIAREQNLSDKVECLGRHDAKKVNIYLNIASLLAIPDTVTDLTASPLKLFEYAAVKRPILLPNLPALKEILPDDSAIYFERGNTELMQHAIEWAYTQPDKANQQALLAYQRIVQYTYTNRAQIILNLI